MMWRNDRERPDDPRTHERETRRLARDEYDRPRYGSARTDFGHTPGTHPWQPDNLGMRMQPPSQGQAQPRWNIAGPTRAPERPRTHVDASRKTQPAEAERPQENIDNMRVHELMTRRVSSVHPATSVERAARLMEECDCGALPVIGDNGVLVGMVTDRDIAVRVIARGRDARNAIVADCMTERVFACYANESVAQCMSQMARHRVRRMPIVDERGRLVGIVAQADLARHALQRPAQDERNALVNVVGSASQPTHTPYR